jgi:hypothetical protein
MLASHPRADASSMLSAFSTVVGGGFVLLATALVFFLLYLLTYALQTSLYLLLAMFVYAFSLGVAVISPAFSQVYDLSVRHATSLVSFVCLVSVLFGSLS